MEFRPTAYKLINCSTARIFEDEGWTINDPESDKPSLIRAVYEKKKFEAREDLDGLYRYANWLPVKRILKHSAAPITYKSKGLAKRLNLRNLYITFSGFFPARGCEMETCSFKETEAYSVCGRLPQDCKKVLVVASAGNTARAFAKVCSENNIPLLVCIPDDNIDALWFQKKLNSCVKIVSTPQHSDYADAITLGDIVCKSDMFLPEGGAKNIARRDGMGTALLSAIETIEKIPDAYFQAVGSGTGTIAVWENNLRLIEDGRFGNHKMKLFPSQNDPFTIIYDSWKAHQRQLVSLSAEEARYQAAIIQAKVLSNRKPPYSLPGGLFDAIEDTDGDMYKISNREIDRWSAEFQYLEGIDIYSAAAVAVASLAHAVEDGSVKKKNVIMLNITGGGEALTKDHHRVIYAKPDLTLDPASPQEEIIKKVEALFK